jgi:SAM-dependent methyltransferase
MSDTYQCRTCGSDLFNKLVHLKRMPLTDDFIKVKELKVEFLQDIKIYQCGNCNLVQNPVNFNYQEYYQDYEYSSGHSEFTKEFMSNYAKKTFNAYKSQNGTLPKSVIEIGSGDGEQLKYFGDLGIERVLGVEPSSSLVRNSESAGIPALESLYTKDIVKKFNGQKFDICISSYTFDHIPNPIEYLRTSHEILTDGGILAFEVHNVDDIYQRSEWCLLEHEHTIYMNKDSASKLVRECGFKIIAMNPIKASKVRANSLIIVAQKIENSQDDSIIGADYNANQYQDMGNRIDRTILKIDQWIDSIPLDNSIVGWGVGGRGVMTLAALRNSDRFQTIFDSNYESNQLLTPKTRISISGKGDLRNFRNAWVLIFSFGYTEEITKDLLNAGFDRDKIFALDHFYNE